MAHNVHHAQSRIKLARIQNGLKNFNIISSKSHCIVCIGEIKLTTETAIRKLRNVSLNIDSLTLNRLFILFIFILLGKATINRGSSSDRVSLVTRDIFVAHSTQWLRIAHKLWYFLRR